MLNNRYLSLTRLLTLEPPASNRLQCLTNESQDTFEEPFTMVSTGEITDVSGISLPSFSPFLTTPHVLVLADKRFFIHHLSRSLRRWTG